MMKPEKLSLERRPSNEGYTIYKGLKVRISLLHSRNIEEIKWSREGFKRNSAPQWAIN